MTDESHVTAIRVAIAALKNAISAARSDGLNVRLTGRVAPGAWTGTMELTQPEELTANVTRNW